MPKKNQNLAPKNFRVFLKDELARRARENPKYSLRDFSKDLRIDCSALSKMLNGKRVMGRKIITKLAAQLGLGPNEITSFIEGTVKTKNSSYEKALDFGQMDQDVYDFYAHWPNYALHSLMKANSFQMDKRWISKKLGLNVNEVSAMLDRFERLGIIEEKAGKKVLRSSTTITTLGRDVGDAPRQMQLELMATAKKKLQNLSLEERDFSTVFFRMDDRQMKLAKDLILEFRRNLVDIVNKKSKGTDIYALSINLFPLTEEE